MVAPRRILVVDDEPTVRESCQRIFAERGYDVETAGSADEGLERARRGYFDCALIDLKMPGRDGMDLVRNARESRSNMAVVIITGYDSVDTAAEAARLGVADYVSKPFKPDEIVGAVERALRRSPAGGVAETETFVGPPTGSSAFAHNAIASQGHIGDFYRSGYGASGDDASPPHHGFNSLADFMGTSQDSTGSVNGGTTFFYFDNGAPFTEADAVGYGVWQQSGLYGIGEYVDWCSGGVYDANDLYNQYISEQGLQYGFTYDQYKAEIDAGRPVLIQVKTHTMCGVGYTDGTRIIQLYDTWSPGPHTMTWAGSYSGLAHYGVTVFEPIPEPAAIGLFALAGLALLKRRRS